MWCPLLGKGHHNVKITLSGQNMHLKRKQNKCKSSLLVLNSIKAGIGACGHCVYVIPLQ